MFKVEVQRAGYYTVHVSSLCKSTPKKGLDQEKRLL